MNTKMPAFLLPNIKPTSKIIFINKMLSYIFILSMISVSLFLSDKEIILPEMAALAVGCIIYEHPVWISKPLHIFLLPSLTAICGFLINRLDITMAEKLIAILIVMLLVLRIFKSSLAPALATGLLPIITNCTSFSFIASILVFTLILALGLFFKPEASREKKGIVIENQNRNTLLYLVFISSWILFCSHFGWLFMAAIPPIIVVGYESVHKKEYTFDVFYKQIICLFLAAFIGAQTLYFIDNLIIVAFVDILLVSLVLRLFQFKMPPVYAMALLPMVLHNFSHNYFYFQVLLVSIVILSTVYFYKKIEAKNRSISTLKQKG